jgi:hypothetical protein
MKAGIAPIEPKRFNADEAYDQLGRRVRLREEFSGIPAGAIGIVIQADEIHPDFFDLLVEWELPTAGKSAPTWFTQDEFERYLEEC